MKAFAIAQYDGLALNDTSAAKPTVPKEQKTTHIRAESCLPRENTTDTLHGNKTSSSGTDGGHPDISLSAVSATQRKTSAAKPDNELVNFSLRENHGPHDYLSDIRKIELRVVAFRFGESPRANKSKCCELHSQARRVLNCLETPL